MTLAAGATSGTAHTKFAKWFSVIIMMSGFVLILTYAFQVPGVRNEALRILLQLGLFIFFFGGALMLSQVFGEQQTLTVKGIVFTGTLALLWGLLFMAKDFIIPPDEFSHPDLDLVVVCRTAPSFSEGKLNALLGVTADTEKIQRVSASSDIMSEDEFLESFTHLERPSVNNIYIKARDRGSRFTFHIDDLLPVSSADQLRVILTTVTQSGEPQDYVIFSSYFATQDGRRLIAEIDLVEAGNVCEG